MCTQQLHGWITRGEITAAILTAVLFCVTAKAQAQQQAKLSCPNRSPAAASLAVSYETLGKPVGAITPVGDKQRHLGPQAGFSRHCARRNGRVC